MLFYEAPHKLAVTLADLREAFGGDRRISLCRELTKLHEEVQRLTLDEAVRLYEEVQPRGEYVLVLAGAEPKQDEGASEEAALAKALKYLEAGMSKKDAARLAAEETGFPKNALYEKIKNN